jgi:excisionase family DNA binding protein
MKENIDLNEWITTTEAAAIRDISPQGILHLIAHDKIRHIKMGRQYFLNRKEVQNYEPDKGGRPRKKKRKK